MRSHKTLSGRLTGPVAAAALGGALLLGGCKPSEEPTVPPTPTPVNPIPKVSAAGAKLDRPTTLVLSADGNTVYVFSFATTGTAQLLAGPVTGPLQAMPLPFAYPTAAAAPTNSSALFVADAGDAGLAGSAGALYRLSLTSGASVLTMGQVRSPSGVGVSPDDSTVYVTGFDVSDGQPAVWKTPAAGGSFDLIFKGAPLQSPAGLAVGSDGSVYVADNNSLGPNAGAVYRIQANRAIQINKAPIRLNYPAGIAPTGLRTAGLLVTVNPIQGTSWLYNLALDGTLTAVDAPGAATPNEPGAIARAPKADVWVAVDNILATQADPDNPQGQLVQLTP